MCPESSNRTNGRSAITNGTLLPGIDGRSAYARRLRDVMAAHLADLGGPDMVSAAEASIIRRAAILTVELEILECNHFAVQETDPIVLEIYARVSSSLRRLLEAVGLQRRAKPVELSLAGYIREIESQKADKAKAEDVEAVA